MFVWSVSQVVKNQVSNFQYVCMHASTALLWIKQDTCNYIATRVLCQVETTLLPRNEKVVRLEV